MYELFLMDYGIQLPTVLLWFFRLITVAGTLYNAYFTHANYHVYQSQKRMDAHPVALAAYHRDCWGALVCTILFAMFGPVAIIQIYAWNRFTRLLQNLATNGELELPHHQARGGRS